MDDQKPQPAAPLGWCIVEIMGHVQLAGYVTEEVRFGEALLRVDVPEVPARPEVIRPFGFDQPAYPAIPAFTRYYGGKAIYSLTPTTEAAARAFATNRRVEPPIRLDPVAPALGPVKDAEVEERTPAAAVECWNCDHRMTVLEPNRGIALACDACDLVNVLDLDPAGRWMFFERGAEPGAASSEGQG